MIKKSSVKYPQIKFASDSSILVRVGESFSRELFPEVFKTYNKIRRYAEQNIRSIHPAYNSILVTFNMGIFSPAEMFDIINEAVNNNIEISMPENNIVEIPVCYEKEFAPDIEEVSKHTGFTVEDVIRRHSNEIYLVYFIGFSPGFPYLGELPNELTMPRMQTPRIIVPAGSVAIGGNQTGIYPIDSPGGWRIIGKTPLKLFTPENESPTLLQMGDNVKFVPITKTEFEKLV